MEYHRVIPLTIQPEFSVFVENARLVFHPSAYPRIEVTATVYSAPKVRMTETEYKFGGCRYRDCCIFVYGNFRNLFVHIEAGSVVVGRLVMDSLKIFGRRAAVFVFAKVEKSLVLTSYGNIVYSRSTKGTLHSLYGSVFVNKYWIGM